jgi:hypothetical protein
MGSIATRISELLIDPTVCSSECDATYLGLILRALATCNVHPQLDGISLNCSPINCTSTPFDRVKGITGVSPFSISETIKGFQPSGRCPREEAAREDAARKERDRPYGRSYNLSSSPAKYPYCCPNRGSPCGEMSYSLAMQINTRLKGVIVPNDSDT